MFYLKSFSLELYTNILNVLNTRHGVNVYRNTGTAEDDGWLTSRRAAQFLTDQEYVALYRAFNLENRWAYAQINRADPNRNDVFGAPRQLRFGVRLEY